jgi:hypothetical protein
MIEQFTSFITLFRQGKELTHSATWKNRTIATNCLVSVFGAVLVIAKGYGYDFPINEESIQNIAVGAVAVVGAINAVMHVITSSKVGLPAKS